MRIPIRQEAPTDIAAIEAVTIEAFRDVPHTSHTEQFIVRALREAGQLAVSLVADENGTVVGHVAASPVAISDGSRRWYGLGPVSVAPDRHGQGIGAQLVQQAMAELRGLEAAGCVVLGDPKYYARFGFRAEPSLSLAGVPPGYFQAMSFSGALPTGEVSYHASFAAQR